MIVESITQSNICDIDKVSVETKLDPLYKRRITAMIKNDDLVLFAARHSGVYVGRVSLWLAPVDEALPREKYPGVPFINALEVKKSYRKQGIATKLINALEEEVIARGIHSIALGVEPDNAAAIALYKKLGYEFTGDIYESCWEEESDGEAKRVCVECKLMLKIIYVESEA